MNDHGDQRETLKQVQGDDTGINKLQILQVPDVIIQ